MLYGVDGGHAAQHRVEQACGAEADGHWPLLERQVLRKVSRGSASPRSCGRPQNVRVKASQRSEEGWDEPVEPVSLTGHVSSWNTGDEAGQSCGSFWEHCYDQEATRRPPVSRFVRVGEVMELRVARPLRQAAPLSLKVEGGD